MSNSVQVLLAKINEYKSKYYKNQLLKGSLIGIALLLTAFLFFNFIEYFGRLNSSLRALLLFAFVGVCLYTLVYLIGKPLAYFFRLKQGFSDTEAARDIGLFFPEIGDKLLNTLQLSSGNDSENALLLASIEQKSNGLKLYQFTDAINLKENRKYLKYAIPPLLLVLLISAVSPSFFKSSERIIKFRQEFAEEAPFDFLLINNNLEAYRNEDFTVNLKMSGSALPEEVFLVYNERRFKMTPAEGENTAYSYTFNKLQQNVDFKFEASGFSSESFEIMLLNRPELLSFDIIANYPAYLGKQPEKLENVGNLVVPEGTSIQWIFHTQFADSVALVFDKTLRLKAKQSHSNEYIYNKKVLQSSDYQIVMKNNQAVNDEKINYYINVIPDQAPKIQLEQIRDSVLYNYIALGGSISDDYGLSDFKLHYRLKNRTEKFENKPIGFTRNSISQTFFFQFDLSQLKLQQDDELEYYLELWDNDGVRGPKSVKTATMSFALPSVKEFDQEVEKQFENTESKMDQLLQKSRDLKKSLEEIDKTLKTKKNIDYQDKRKLEDLLKKREEMLKDLRDLQKQFDQMQEKQNRFQQQNPETQEKMEQLQKLMNELMQNEDSELFKKLEEMLQKNENENIMEQLQKMKENDRNLDRDIERTMKLFKNMQLQQKVEQLTQELEKLAEKQEDLAKETQENKDPAKNDQLEKDQKKLSDEFKDKQEKAQEIEKLSKVLRKDVDTQKSEQQETKEQQQKAEQQLKNDDNQGASKSQKKAAQSMRKMAEQMSAEMQSAEMKQLDLDMDALRAILENLVKLSFDQEKLMKDFKGLSKSDPRFVDLSQQQLKLVDDAKVIEDSLYSLAQRVMQIETFVTKEVTDMKNSMDQSITLLRDRNLPKATAKQQFSMTSMNNLALMLSDTFKQMQQMMSMAMPGSGSGKDKGSMPSPGIGKQQQQLNERMKGMGQQGQNASEFSKELAKIANEQAKIRKQLKDMQERLNGTELGEKLGGELEKLQQEMDETEKELVNKRVNPKLIQRQDKLLTRLLEAEKAIKEQELDPKRKSKTAMEFERPSPPSLEKFMKEKTRQQELIRTTPPNFTPYYKQETDSYFRKLN